MRAVVLDTGVSVTANGQSPQAGPDCLRRCRQVLDEIVGDRAKLVLDDEWRIIREYRANLPMSGPPGFGRTFLIWVLTNHSNPARCEQVTIHPRAGSAGDFLEFPQTDDLADFDPSDRKFVAVARAHGGQPPIQLGVDSKWWGWRAALEREGVAVELLCPAEVEEIYARKFPRRDERGQRPT